MRRRLLHPLISVFVCLVSSIAFLILPGCDGKSRSDGLPRLWAAIEEKTLGDGKTVEPLVEPALCADNLLNFAILLRSEMERFIAYPDAKIGDDKISEADVAPTFQRIREHITKTYDIEDSVLSDVPVDDIREKLKLTELQAPSWMGKTWARGYFEPRDFLILSATLTLLGSDGAGLGSLSGYPSDFDEKEWDEKRGLLTLDVAEHFEKISHESQWRVVLQILSVVEDYSLLTVRGLSHVIEIVNASRDGGGDSDEDEEGEDDGHSDVTSNTATVGEVKDTQGDSGGDEDEDEDDGEYQRALQAAAAGAKNGGPGGRTAGDDSQR